MNEFSDAIELTPASPRAAALVFHGLSGSPDNVRDISDRLYQENFYTYAPALSGHSGDFEEFRTLSHNVWLEDTNKAFKHVKELHGDLPIIVIGQSFGALLSLYLASTYPTEISNCVAIACPMKFRDFKMALFLSFFSYFPDQYLNFLGIRPKTYDKEGTEEGYNKHSLAAVARMVKIRRIVKSRLHLIQCPVLIGQDLSDHHVSEESMEILKSHISSASLTQKEFPGAGHRLFHGPGSESVIDQVLDFII